MDSKINYGNMISKFGFLLFIIIVLIGIISDPQLTLDSAFAGITLWLNIIIPTLFPFFVISELLIGLGFVDFIGNLLAPIMYPLFNVNGQGAFPLTMSVISGYPVGAKLSSRLREKGKVTKEEGDRLICFTSTSGPLFILGAVSIGMLKDPNVGLLLLIPHYLSIIILGIIFSNYKRKSGKIGLQRRKNLLDEIQTTYGNWVKTKKSIGSLITESIKESMDAVILIGGLVIFYSVLVEIIFNIGLVNNLLYKASKHFLIDIQLIKGILIGFFEITTGCKNISLSTSNLGQKILVINFLIGWGGISVHSQALSFIKNTDLNSKLFVISKFLHGLLSATLGYVLYQLKFKEYILSTFARSPLVLGEYSISNWLYLFISSMELSITIGIFMFLLSIFSYLIFDYKGS